MSFRDQQLVVPSWPFTVNRESPQAQGLVAWWPILHEHGGNSVHCMIDTRNHGAYASGSQAWGMSPFGFAAAQFTGSSSHQVTGFTQALGDFTATVWFTPTGTDFFGRVIDKDSGNGFVICRDSSNSNSHKAELRGTSIGPIAIQDGYPHLGVVRRRGTSGILNFDGLATQATASVSGSALSSDALKIGGGGNPGANRIWDVRVYNRALGDSEVAALYDPSTRYELFYPLGERLYVAKVGGGGGGGSTARSQVVIIG